MALKIDLLSSGSNGYPRAIEPTSTAEKIMRKLATTGLYGIQATEAIKKFKKSENTMAKSKPVNMKALFKSVPTNGIHTMEEVSGEKIKKLPQTLINQVIILNILV